jgi:thymidylate synthase (FAD)
VEYVGHVGTDLTPVESARLSTNTKSNIDKTKDDNLRDRLIYDLHTSTFESNYLILRFKLPMFVLRQIERHRTIDECGVTIESIDDEWRKYHSRNEFSGRYSVVTNEHYLPHIDYILKQSKTNKQGSQEGFSKDEKLSIQKKIDKHNTETRTLYDEFIEAGMAKELARIVLDDSKFTIVQYSANLLNWAKFLTLRLKPDVQPQTIEYAKLTNLIIKSIWPECHKSLEEHLIWAEKYSKSEHEMTKKIINRYVDNTDIKAFIIEEMGERCGKRYMKKIGING